MIESIESKYQKEIDLIKQTNEERDALLNIFKQEHANNINIIKSIESRNKYEDKISTIQELETNKRSSGIFTLSTTNNTIESKILELHNTIINLNIKVSPELELNEIKEWEKYKTLEIEEPRFSKLQITLCF